MKQMYDFLLHIVKLDYHSLNSLIVTKLKDYYDSSLITHHDDKENSFIYVKGSQPYMLVAHTDTVHKQPVKEILITKSLTNAQLSHISSPQGIGGDDRNGIALIFALLDAGHRPSILFPSGEEIGTKGATRFTETFNTLDNVNLILQFDRRNNLDVTRYADDNDALIREIIALGYTEVSGSFSDISVICPKYFISGVNISASFFDEHTLSEYTDLRGLVNTFNQIDKLLRTDMINKKYVYKPKTYTTTGYTQTSLFDWDYSYPPKANKLVNDYKENSCSQCGLYGGKLHPVADSNDYICQFCTNNLQNTYVCLGCDELNSFNGYTEITFDFKTETASIPCYSCGTLHDITNLFTEDVYDHMISILMGSFKDGGL